MLFVVEVGYNVYVNRFYYRNKNVCGQDVWVFLLFEKFSISATAWKDLLKYGKRVCSISDQYTAIPWEDRSTIRAFALPRQIPEGSMCAGILAECKRSFNDVIIAACLDDAHDFSCSWDPVSLTGPPEHSNADKHEACRVLHLNMATESHYSCIIPSGGIERALSQPPDSSTDAALMDH